MNRSRLFLFCFLVLLILLYFVSLQGVVKGQGKILAVSSFDQITIIKVEGFNEELVLFNKEAVNVAIGDVVSFEGIKNTYQGRKQIEVRKVFLIT